jgi:hypothetical protein
MKNLLRICCMIICLGATVGFAQNAPQSILGTVVSIGSSAVVPVYAINFNDISSCNLHISFDPAVASVTSVTIGPAMVGMISTNLSVPGNLLIGWFTSSGISLPDSSVIFYLNTVKAGNGFTPFHWVNDGHSCNYSNGSFEILNDNPSEDFYTDGSLIFQSSEAPVTTCADVAAMAGNVVSIPVSVGNFDFIGSFSLALTYNPDVLTYLTNENSAGFPDFNVDGTEAGNIIINGFVTSGDTAISLPDDAVLFTLNFNYQGGFTVLEWFDNGPSCQYNGSVPVYPELNDLPQMNYYHNGSVSENALPASAGVITGPASVCNGSTGIVYSTPVIAYATAYTWAVPEGATIVSGENTPAISVDFENAAQSGVISVFGTNEFGSGAPSLLNISIELTPYPAGNVAGIQEVCQGQQGVAYSITPIANANTYIWSLPEGCIITAGNFTNNITVAFSNAASSGSTTVYGSNQCGNGMASLPFQILVNEIPEILVQPQSPPAVHAGSGSALFTVEATGTGLSLQWQEYNNGWADLIENDMYKGVLTDSLVIVNPLLSMNGSYYRCLISGVCDPTAVTDGNAMLTVLVPVETNQHPLDNPEWNIYPNPCKSELAMELNYPIEGKLKITIVNILGETIEVINQMNIIPGNHLIKINTADLTSGFYLIGLCLETEDSLVMQTKKFVCNH